MQIDDLTLDAKRKIQIVRDDTLLGGTKIRGLIPYLQEYIRLNTQVDEFIYASPAYGFAQVAIAVSAQKLGKKATIFVAKRNVKHPNTELAIKYGANVVEIPYGYLVVIKKRAMDYCAIDSLKRQCLPWGLDCAEFKTILTKELVNVVPFKQEKGNVWVCVGSGTVFQCLTEVCPNAKFNLVQIGAKYTIPDHLQNRVNKLYVAPEKFSQKSKKPPSAYPSNSWYDAKIWQFVEQYAENGDIIWNVA